LDSGETRLLSVGKDRMLVEYDLVKSNYDELIIKEKVRIEQYAVPNAVVWHPTGVVKESFLLTVNDQVNTLQIYIKVHAQIMFYVKKSELYGLFCCRSRSQKFKKFINSKSV
jgi:hypothetical protein